MSEGFNYPELLYQHNGHDVDVLEKNAKENPFSSLASFLLLYHYKKNNHPDFEKLAKRTALHFNNPHWLQYILNKAAHTTKQENIIQENLPIEKEKPGEINLGNLIDMEVANDIIQQENIVIPPQIHEIKTEGITETLYDHNLQQQPEAIAKENQFQTNDSNTEAEKNVEANKPVTEEMIAFEPLHTVDYFASQGIKITDEPVTSDKLGNQMKSFTQWLKSMKRLHPGKLEEQTMVNEKQIQSAAEESNINTEILTEAMADVLIKQDKKEKAIEMFSKLSLINPAKSAYFAAKIESIKSS